jgi:hypothetical protein
MRAGGWLASLTAERVHDSDVFTALSPVVTIEPYHDCSYRLVAQVLLHLL